MKKRTSPNELKSRYRTRKKGQGLGIWLNGGRTIQKKKGGTVKKAIRPRTGTSMWFHEKAKNKKNGVGIWREKYQKE